MMSSIADSDTSKTRSKGRRRPLQDQKFSSYLSFGLPVSVCLGVFFCIYALVLLCASPLLLQQAPTTDVTHMARGQVLQPVVHKIGERVKSMPVALKEQLSNFRKGQGAMDMHLISKAEEELKRLRKRREDSAAAIQRKEEAGDAVANTADVATNSKGNRTGFFVLGMHRSGTSMLSGLMVTGLGYNVGGPLIGVKFDNEKGFFERIDAVLQNDEFMNLQRVWWSANVLNYDADKALQEKKAGYAKFTEGRKALAFLNNEDNSPYLQKDPRMCITLKTWLPLLNHEPAILWTYRHPIEVSNSLIRRESTFTLDHVLRLWIVYNMRGIQNSAGLCRVYSSNDAILANPLNETLRLSRELTSKCGIPAPPNELTEEQVAKFVDTSLQHNKKKIGDDLPVIAEYGSDCKVHDLVTKTVAGSQQYEREKKFYLAAMKIYCDMESGAAYQDAYEWPPVPV